MLFQGQSSLKKNHTQREPMNYMDKIFSRKLMEKICIYYIPFA